MPTNDQFSEEVVSLADEELIDRLRSGNLTEVAADIVRQELAARDMDVASALAQPAQGAPPPLRISVATRRSFLGACFAVSTAGRLGRRTALGGHRVRGNTFLSPVQVDRVRSHAVVGRKAYAAVCTSARLRCNGSHRAGDDLVCIGALAQREASEIFFLENCSPRTCGASCAECCVRNSGWNACNAKVFQFPSRERYGFHSKTVKDQCFWQ
jgi:hypothetical protein